MLNEPQPPHELLQQWNSLLDLHVLTNEDFPLLKSLCSQLYKEGFMQKIVRDLNKANLKSVIIPALLQGYQFSQDNHIYLEIASHLLFFNKSCDILLNDDRVPLFYELKDILELHANKTEKDTFYLIYPRSAQVIYYNKLTKSATIFICDYNGWGLRGEFPDHIFQVLLFRRLAHVDCLVDVPKINLPSDLNLRTYSNANQLEKLKQAIEDGSLFLAFYNTYIKKCIDNPKEYDDFCEITGYSGYRSDLYPQKLIDHGYKLSHLKSFTNRSEPFDGYENASCFMDYLEENLFPTQCNEMYNRGVYCKYRISLHEHHYRENQHIIDQLHVSMVIAHRFIEKQYLTIDTKEDLVQFLLIHMNELKVDDYGQTRIERLDYAYLYHVLFKEQNTSFEMLLEWLVKNYKNNDNYPALEYQISNIVEQENKANLELLHQQFVKKYKDTLTNGLFSFFYRIGINPEILTIPEIIHHAQHGSPPSYTGERSFTILKELQVFNEDMSLNESHRCYQAIKSVLYENIPPPGL